MSVINAQSKPSWVVSNPGRLETFFSPDEKEKTVYVWVIFLYTETKTFPRNLKDFFISMIDIPQPWNMISLQLSSVSPGFYLWGFGIM
jgi:hypothetical protein